MDHFQKEHYAVLNWKDAVHNQLVPVIKHGQNKVKITFNKQLFEVDQLEQSTKMFQEMKIVQQNETRESKFMKEQHEKILKMISGQYQYEKQKLFDDDMKGQIQNYSQNTQGKSRAQKLLQAAANKQNTQDVQMQIEDQPIGGPAQNRTLKMENEEIYRKFAPSEDQHFKDIFTEWVRDFHQQYLSCDIDQKHKSEIQVQTGLFHIKANKFDNSINPDVAGNIIKSIFDSQEQLRVKVSDGNKSS